MLLSYYCAGNSSQVHDFPECEQLLISIFRFDLKTCRLLDR